MDSGLSRRAVVHDCRVAIAVASTHVASECCNSEQAGIDGSECALFHEAERIGHDHPPLGISIKDTNTCSCTRLDDFVSHVAFSPDAVADHGHDTDNTHTSRLEKIIVREKVG